MKIILFLTILISVNLNGQNFPHFNPLINVYTKDFIRDAYLQLKSSKFFVGQLGSDSIINGKYQNQKIQVKKLDQGLDIVIYFKNKVEYLKFLLTAKDFFVKKESSFDSETDSNTPCNIYSFIKPDFKEENLEIKFLDCSNKIGKLDQQYKLHINPGIKFCGNPF